MHITVDLNINFSSPELKERMDKVLSVLTDLQAAQATEKADITALVTAVGNLLTAFASGALTPAQAQTIAAEMTSEDSSIKSLTSQINAALNPTPPGP